MTARTTTMVKITLSGAGGSFDAGVQEGTTTRSLLADDRVRTRLGLTGPDEAGRAQLVRRNGAVLLDGVPLVDQSVRAGDVLTLVPERGTSTGASEPVGELQPADDIEVAKARGARKGWAVWAVAIGLLAAVLAAAVGASAGGLPLVLSSSVLLLAALGAALLAPADRWGDTCRLLAPGAAAAGTGALLAGPGPGPAQLAVTAAVVGAAVVTTTARSRTADRPFADHLLVVLVALAGLAFLLGVVLLGGMPLRTAAAIAAGIGLLLVRLLPGLVVDVPDEALLELDRLSVTAWSAHEQHHGPAARPQRGRRGGPSGRAVRASEVLGVVTRGYRLYRTSIVTLSALTAGGALVVLLDPGAGWAPYGSLTLACCVAALLLLAARAVRDALGRGALRIGGGAVALVLCATEVLRAEGPWRGLYAGLAVGLGVVAVVAAVALGRGWRSVRWGRLGDLAEGVALSLALPAALAAAGLLDWVRQLAS